MHEHPMAYLMHSLLSGWKFVGARSFTSGGRTYWYADLEARRPPRDVIFMGHTVAAE